MISTATRSRQAFDAHFGCVLAACYSLRVSAVADERALQDAIGEALTAERIGWQREVRLGARSRIDFLTDRVGRAVGIEVKCGRTNTPAVARQVKRYLNFDQVGGIVLVTEQAVHGNFDFDAEKPVEVVTTSKLWGIAT